MGIVVSKRITKTYYKDKITLLNAKFAQGLITKSQYTQYTSMLKKWTTINKKTFNVKIKLIKQKEKSGEITKKDVKIQIKKLKLIVKPAVKITRE